MLIGVPREIKESENRVSLTPAGAASLVQAGHTVLVEAGAGSGSGFNDKEYRLAGAETLEDRQRVWAEAELLLKVKEPLPEEYGYFRKGLLLFTYLHLAAAPGLAAALLRGGVVALGYETVQRADHSLPLLAPMSEIAGRLSVQVGSRFLEEPEGGRGILLGGVPGVPPADVLILGGGIAGRNAARVALGMGGQVKVMDRDAERLRYLDDLFGGRVQTISSNTYNVARGVTYADLLIGAVLRPGARAPHLVSEEMVKGMKQGAVIVDISIDQGGCVETIDHATTHKNPTYIKHGVVHYAVANMPAAVPRTSTFALTNATLPYILRLAEEGWRAAARDAELASGFNTCLGRLTHAGVAEALNLPYEKPLTIAGME